MLCYAHSGLVIPESMFRLLPLTARLPFFPFFFENTDDMSEEGASDAMVRESERRRAVSDVTNDLVDPRVAVAVVLCSSSSFC